MDYVTEWECEEEDELVIEKAELEKVGVEAFSRAGFGSTEHRNLVFLCFFVAAGVKAMGGLLLLPRLY